MRNKQTLKILAANIVLQFVTLFSGLILPRYYLLAYGSAMNGMMSSVGQFAAYIGLVESGVGAAAVISLYRPLSEHNDRGVNAVLSSVKKFYCHAGWAYLSLGVLLLVLYPRLIGTQVSPDITRAMIAILLSTGAMDYFLLGKYKVLLQADQKGYFLSGVHAIGIMMVTALSILMIRGGEGILKVKVIAVWIYLFRFFVVRMYIRHGYQFLDFHTPPDNNALKHRWSVLIHQFVGLVVNNTDIVLLTIFLKGDSLEEVSVYTVYSMVSNAVTSLLNAFAGSFTPGFGQMLSSGKRDTLTEDYKIFEYIYFMLLSACYTCMGILLLPFIRLYTSGIDDVNYIRPEIAVLFVLIGFIRNLRQPALTMICASGDYRQTQGAAVTEAAINLVISLSLVKRFGIVGVLAGTFCSYCYRTWDVIRYNGGKIVKMAWQTTLGRIVRNTSVMAGYLLLASRWRLNTAGSYSLWLRAAVCHGCTALAVLIFVNLIAEWAEMKKIAVWLVHLRKKR